MKDIDEHRQNMGYIRQDYERLLSRTYKMLRYIGLRVEEEDGVFNVIWDIDEDKIPIPKERILEKFLKDDEMFLGAYEGLDLERAILALMYVQVCDDKIGHIIETDFQ